MAKICSPYATPKFIERSESVDRGEWLGQALKNAEASGLYTKVREGFDAEYIRNATAHLGQMLPMNWDDLNNYFVKNGWLRPDMKATKEAHIKGYKDTVYKAGRLSGEEEGFVASITKTYLESTAGAVSDAADAFLRKVNAGEAATAEGMIFAQQMQHLSRFGGYVLGWDQSVGRGLRQQMLRSGNVRAVRDSDKFLQETADQLGNMGEYADKFKEIAAKLQDPDQSVDGVNELINLAKRVQFLGDPRKIAKTSMSLEIAGNAINEVMINGLLSGPATFVANASGLGWVVARPLLQYIAASGYAAVGLPGAKHATRAAAEAAASLAAIRQGWMDGMQLGWHAAKTERTIYQAGASQELAERVGIHGEHVKELIARRGWNAPDDAWLDAVTRVGELVRIPGRALMGTDEMAKHLAVRAEVAARGVQRAADAGIDLTDKAALDAFLAKEADMAFNLQRPELWEKYKVNSVYNLNTGVLAEADRATFQELNGFAQKVTGLVSSVPGLKPFVPFVRTPLNILKQGFVESTGLGPLWKGYKLAQGAGFNPTAAKLAIVEELLADPGETFRIAGQIGLTTTMAAAFYGLAMSGELVGGGPGRWTPGGRASDAQRAWERAMAEQGKVKYSIYGIPFDRFGEPIAIVLRMAADMGMYSSYVPHAAQEEWLAGMAGIMVSGLYQASFLTGINDLVDVITDTTPGGQKLGRGVQNYVATFTPFGGLLNYVDKVQDPFRSAYQGASFLEVMRVHEDTFGTGIFAKIADRVPGLGRAPQLIDQLLGEPVPAYPGGGPTGLNPLQMAVPFLPRGGEGQENVWTAVWNIKGGYKEKRPTNLDLTAAEQQELNRRMATMTLGRRTVRDAVMEFYRRADVQQYVRKRGAAFEGVKTAIETELDGIINDYFQAAFNSMLIDNRELRKRYMLSEAARQSARNNDVVGATDAKRQLDELFREAKMRGVF